MNTKYKNLPIGDHKRQHIVVFSGAGMSAESGLSTFRDENGLWKQYDWQRLASIEGFAEEPQAVLDFYNMLGITDIEIPEEYRNEELMRLTYRKKDESGIEIGEHPLFFNEKLDDCK